MDIFYEYMVKHTKSNKEKLQNLGIVILSIILTLVLGLFIGKLMGFELILLVGIWYGAVFLISRTNIEYEYILTNSNLDIDKVMAKKSRKRIISIDFKNIEVCGPANDPNFKHILANTQGKKVMDLSGNISDSNVYFVDFVKNAINYRVFFQPNAKILYGIKIVNPREITVIEEQLQ